MTEFEEVKQKAKLEETERQLKERMKGVDLSEIDIYIIRSDMGLPAEKPQHFPKEEDTEISKSLIRGLRMKAWRKLPSPPQTEE